MQASAQYGRGNPNASVIAVNLQIITLGGLDNLCGTLRVGPTVGRRSSTPCARRTHNKSSVGVYQTHAKAEPWRFNAIPVSGTARAKRLSVSVLMSAGEG
jgi:hypothetical protein